MNQQRIPSLGDKFSEVRSDSYSDYPSSEEWAEKIMFRCLKDKSKNWLMTELGKYLSSKYDIPNSPPNKMANWKALELIEGYEREIPDNVIQHQPVVREKGESGRKKALKKCVLEAQRKGFLENFRIHDEPWHPQKFLEGEIVTYPYQHDTAILYRGDSVHHLFDEARSGSRNEGSILEKGYLVPGNSFSSKGGVWTAPFLRYASDQYARSKAVYDGISGPVWELQIPTKWLELNDTVHNLKEMHDRFGSPENLREWMLKKGDSTGKAKPQDASFIVNHRLPLEYVKGVWDTDTHPKKPLFETLESYLNTLYSRFPDRMPEHPRATDYKPKVNIKKREILEEYRHLQKIDEELRKLEESSGRHWQKLRSGLRIPSKSSHDESVNADFYNISQRIHFYDRNIKEIQDLLSDLGHDFETGDEITSAVEMYIKLPQNTQRLHKTREALEKVIVEEKQELKDDDWNRNKLENTRRVDEKVEETVAQNLQGICTLNREKIEIKAQTGREDQIIKRLAEINPDLSDYFDHQRWKIW